MIVFEDSCHDNCVIGSSQFPHHDKDVDYLGFKETSIEEGLKFGSKIQNDITMYIYDLGTDNYSDYQSIIPNNNINIYTKLNI